jgi:hypothetical protein
MELEAVVKWRKMGKEKSRFKNKILLLSMLYKF